MRTSKDVRKELGYDKAYPCPFCRQDSYRHKHDHQPTCVFCGEKDEAKVPLSPSYPNETNHWGKYCRPRYT